MADQWQGGSWRRVDNLKHECESKLGIREFIHSAGPAHVDLIHCLFYVWIQPSDKLWGVTRPLLDTLRQLH